VSKSKKIKAVESSNALTVPLGKVMKAVEAMDGILLVFNPETGAPVTHPATSKPVQRPITMDLLYALSIIGKNLQPHIDAFREAYRAIVEQANQRLAELRASLGLVDGQELNAAQAAELAAAAEREETAANEQALELEKREIAVEIRQKITRQQLERNGVKLTFEQFSILEGWILE
jgi:hypothetical protein